MTAPQQPVARLSERVTKLERQRVTQRAATVVAVHTVTSTFDADVEGAGRLNGIPAPAAFMPAVDDEVTLDLHGATPIYQPHRVGAGTIGEDELDPDVVENITVALDTANGKNKVSFSLVDPPASGYVGTAGDLWFKRVAGTGVITGSWEWDGTAWQARSFGDAVLNSLTAGKIVSGTGVFDLLMAGSIYSSTSGSRYRIDATGIKFWSGADTTPTLDMNAITGNVTFRGTVEGALIRTSSAGQRLEIQGGGTAGGRTLTFYPAGAGQPATFTSRDDGAGNAGLTLTAGGTNRGFLNFNSTFADIGYSYGGSGGSWVRVSDDSYAVAIQVLSGRNMAITTDGKVDFYSGAARFARLSAADGLETVSKFSLPGAGSFTFGLSPGASNADVYALRFISTNPGATGGFIYFSDGRLKRNVRPVTFDALADVMSMPVLKFEWESTGQTGFGFVAQQMPADVQVRLSPDEPIGGVTDPIGVASELVLAKVVRAVQQLNSKVDAMRAAGIRS